MGGMRKGEESLHMRKGSTDGLLGVSFIPKSVFLFGGWGEGCVYFNTSTRNKWLNLSHDTPNFSESV